MSFNGSGTFNINSAGQPVVSGTVISSSTFNTLTADLATGLSTCITKDGQTTVTANIPLNSYKITGLAAGTAATDAARVGQLQAGAASVVTAAGTDTYTGTMSPSLGAYAAGNTFTFVVPNTNTTAATLNIDGLGAKALTRDGSTALVAGDLVANAEVLVVYDGTRFQVLNSNSKTNFNLSGTLTVAGNTTLSGGTANGVAYLNASKVLTSGSALTFDGTNLSGTGSMGTTIASKTAQFNAAGGSIYASFADGTNTWRIGDGIISAGQFNLYDVTNSQTTLGFVAGAAGYSAFYQNNAEGMRLTSTGLGIGTSSFSSKLAVSAAKATVQVTSTTGTNGAYQAFTNTGGNFYTGLDSSTGGEFAAAYAGVMWHGGAYPLIFGTSNTEKMRLDSSGNLGIGTTSPAYKLDVNGVANFAANVGHRVGTALFLAGTGTSSGLNYLYTNTTAMAWRNAADSSELMRLDNSGNLLIGSTSTGGKLCLQVGATATGIVQRWAATGGTAEYFEVNSVNVGSITTTTTATVYNTVSDYRLKEFVAPVTNSGERIDALNPVEFDWKETGSRARGFFAHEFQQVYASSVNGTKDAVDEDGNPVYQAMQASTAEVIADLVAEIKSLRVRLNSLENK